MLSKLQQFYFNQELVVVLFYYWLTSVYSWQVPQQNSKEGTHYDCCYNIEEEDESFLWPSSSVVNTNSKLKVEIVEQWNVECGMWKRYKDIEILPVITFSKILNENDIKN